MVSFEKGAMSTIGAMRHAHWMFVKGSNGHHLLILSVIGELILSVNRSTA
jgi:hypothetical protein